MNTSNLTAVVEDSKPESPVDRNNFYELGKSYRYKYGAGEARNPDEWLADDTLEEKPPEKIRLEVLESQVAHRSIELDWTFETKAALSCLDMMRKRPSYHLNHGAPPTEDDAYKLSITIVNDDLDCDLRGDVHAELAAKLRTQAEALVKAAEALESLEPFKMEPAPEVILAVDENQNIHEVLTSSTMASIIEDEAKEAGKKIEFHRCAISEHPLYAARWNDHIEELRFKKKLPTFGRFKHPWVAVLNSTGHRMESFAFRESAEIFVSKSEPGMYSVAPND